MKIRVITDRHGIIKAFSIRPATYDPKKSGDIFPTPGHIAHDLEMPTQHQQLFLKEPHKVPAALQINLEAEKAAFMPRRK